MITSELVMRVQGLLNMKIIKTIVAAKSLYGSTFKLDVCRDRKPNKSVNYNFEIEASQKLLKLNSNGN
jgi:hypothetical protein